MIGEKLTILTCYHSTNYYTSFFYVYLKKMKAES